MNATGGEFSFQSFAPGTETGFLHTHKNHEELYFFLRIGGDGQGEGIVDGVFRHMLVKTGSPCEHCDALTYATLSP